MHKIDDEVDEDDPDFAMCLDECFDLPILNNASCFCNHSICFNGGYCNQTYGCVTFPPCPQNFTYFYNDTSAYCMCNNETLMDPNTHHCYKNKTLPVLFECPPIPEMANATSCICDNATICYEGIQNNLILLS